MTPDWFVKTMQDMFVLGLPLFEKIIRPIIVYFVLIIGLRVAGKRELAQINPFDLVVLLTLSNTVQNAIIGEDNSVTGGIVGAITLLALNFFMVRFVYDHKNVEKFLAGDEDVLVDHGIIRMERLKQEAITLQELETAAHRQGFGSLEEVWMGVLEPGGGITFVGRKPMPEVGRHQELLARLDQLSSEIATLRGTSSGQEQTHS
jgi:uncharacterized membrane protein YcaP (DUF421 family)